MSKLTEVNEKIADTVVGCYKKIEDTVVGGYQKIEGNVGGSYQKIEDKFVEKFLTKDGETVDEAKARLKEEQNKNSE